MSIPTNSTATTEGIPIPPCTLPPISSVMGVKAEFAALDFVAADAGGEPDIYLQRPMSAPHVPLTNDLPPMQQTIALGNHFAYPTPMPGPANLYNYPYPAQVGVVPNGIPLQQQLPHPPQPQPYHYAYYPQQTERLDGKQGLPQAQHSEATALKNLQNDYAGNGTVNRDLTFFPGGHPASAPGPTGPTGLTLNMSQQLYNPAFRPMGGQVAPQSVYPQQQSAPFQFQSSSQHIPPAAAQQQSQQQPERDLLPVVSDAEGLLRNASVASVGNNQNMIAINGGGLLRVDQSTFQNYMGMSQQGGIPASSTLSVSVPGSSVLTSQPLISVQSQQWGSAEIANSTSIQNDATATKTSNALEQQQHWSGGSPVSEIPVNSETASLFSAAMAHYSRGEYMECEGVCQQLLKIEPRRIDTLLLLGAASYQTREYKKSVSYNWMAIKQNPNFAEAYGNLANALKEMGDLENAIMYYRKAIALKPKFCDGHNNLAAAYIQKGMNWDAIEAYKTCLSINPHRADVHANLGNLLKFEGHLEDAKYYYTCAISIDPKFAIAWSNLAGVLKDQGDTHTAIAYYQEALRLDSDFADAWSNLGNSLKEVGKLQESLQCYQRAVQIRPNFAIAHGNMASVYYDLGQLDVAIQMYRHAVQIDPTFADAYNNLGNALKETGSLDEAIGCYHMCLRIKSDHPHAYNNLGNALKDKGDIKGAHQCYETAIQCLPRFAAGHSNLASLLKDLGRLDEAIAHYQHAISIDPNFADAYSNMGNALKDQGNIEQAIQAYITAISLRPNFADAYSNLASAYKDSGRIEEAIYNYRKALEVKPWFPDGFSNLVHSLVFVCDWTDRDDNFRKLKETFQWQLSQDMVPAVQPFHALVYPISSAEMLAISAKYAQKAALNVAHFEMPKFDFSRRLSLHLCQPGAKRRLRVGFVSSDFGNHPLSHLMQSVFGMHDKSKYEVYCYALTPNDGTQYRQKIAAEAEHFVDLTMSPNNQAAMMIYNDEIDICINLNGYTKGARNEIFALKPAPIQVLYMGFPGTTGASYIDYIVTDEVVSPLRFEKNYSEKFVYMPHSYFVNDHKQSFPHIFLEAGPTRPSLGLPEDKVVLCNFNQLYKIDPAIFTVWMNILKACPNAVLWLLQFPVAGEKHLRFRAREAGVPDHQVIFTEVALKEAHIRRSALADLFLDTPLCNAHTTATDVLWAGVPVLTLPLEQMASRVAAGLLRAAGVDKELVCSSLQDYQDRAISFCKDPDTLKPIRNRLYNERWTSPLFDTNRWVKNLERSYDLMWEGFVSGTGPKHVTVPVTESIGSSPSELVPCAFSNDTRTQASPCLK